MEIIITGDPKSGKTIVATAIKQVLEGLGVSVTTCNLGKYKFAPSGCKPLANLAVNITVVRGTK